VKFSFADSINLQAENNMVETVVLNGKRFDCGIFYWHVKAIKYVSLTHKFLI